MSKDVEATQGAPSPKLEPSGQWKRFWRLVTEPWTLLLLGASIALFVIGQQKLSPSVTALIQILLAVASGVLGARVTNLLESAAGKSILEARGKVAVRGLKLMLVQTAAFQRRVEKFIDNRQHIETNPDVTVRNFEETVEFCRRIQEEAASAMETWVDVVPSADLSSLIGRITAAEDEHEATKRELAIAQQLLDSNKVDVAQTHELQLVIASLQKRLDDSETRIDRLNKRLWSRAGREASTSSITLKANKNFLAGFREGLNPNDKPGNSLLANFLKNHPDDVDSDGTK
ncbi:hypothetical protein [Stenotrophomonas indicatrix]|uniref:hypothetical protein n=1 Tax=Stenotrophomonas indicatrix TaxID=2045451 RepID=UPI001070DDE2|nr:hypothetical protein [Stenotrophomonas indicatrix]QBR44137.1 hypothetical protein DAIF1_17000 [Stenotrophomonas indicatrix]